ncbi:hypothetical protein [Pseudofrankia sp. DC12]|uniref:hypothetical protein n=1 Tax=Pseudofrankia sp. DC12 TaxID=683315 RepID=UPI000A44E04A|nr:hypothetical protein [Pseudofrankia sp. DC12]
MSVVWEGLQPGDVENLIAALLVRTVPGALHVHGAGGDGGVDVVAPVDGGSHVYEIKSFRSLLTPAQKRQVLRSLRTAVREQQDMVAWTLVMPKNPTPAEETWLRETLAAETTAEVAWMGLTALNVAFAEHPALARLHPGAAEHRALDLLVQQRQEEAPLASGVPDALERGRKLRDLAALVDPDYTFDLSFAENAQTIEIRPKDAGANERRPISGVLSLAAPTGSAEAAKIEDFHTYGAPLQLTAPHITNVTVGLPGGLDQLLTDAIPTSLEIGASDTTPQRVTGALLAQSQVIARLPLTVVESTQGLAGGQRLLARDDAGCLSLEFRLAPDSTLGEVQFAFHAGDTTLLGDALTALRFAATLGDAEQIRLGAAGHPPTLISVNDNSTVPQMELDGRIASLEALQRVGDATGTAFTVPQTFTARDDQLLHLVDRVLQAADAKLDADFTGLAVPVTADAVTQILARGPIPRLTMTCCGEPDPQIAGQKLNLPGRLTLHVIDGLIVNTGSLARHAAAGTPIFPPAELAADMRTRAYWAIEPEAS